MVSRTDLSKTRTFISKPMALPTKRDEKTGRIVVDEVAADEWRRKRAAAGAERDESIVEVAAKLKLAASREAGMTKFLKALIKGGGT
jgi:hypothetical protein